MELTFVHIFVEIMVRAWCCTDVKMENNLLVTLLQDSNVIVYLKKHEEVIREYFNVPDGVSPISHVVALSNKYFQSKRQSPLEYRLSPLYCTTKSKCSFCDSKLAVKKTLRITLYDDVLGSREVAVLLKFCKSCKITFYPGFSENYETKKRIYEENWEKYGIFTSTYSTAFSLDFMKRSICLKLKCHTTFFGRTEAFNLQHSYGKEETLKLDKRVLSDAYYKYTLLCFKQRYSLPLAMDIDVSTTLNDELPNIMNEFLLRASRHNCTVAGCGTCIVIDGHMKAHRKICRKKACIEDPMVGSTYCEQHHLNSEQLRDVCNDAQILKNENEYHIEKIMKIVTKDKRRCYQ